VLFIMGDLALGVPVVRDRFQFSPQEFHQVASVVLSTGIGVGLQFP
jgi:hypothetical protein